jgi:aspartate/methionine/tyrosine aminotransferase
MKPYSIGDLDLYLDDLSLRYGHHRGVPELRELIASDYSGLKLDNVCVTTGAAEAIFAIIAVLVGPDDIALVEHPNYPSLYDAVYSLERKVEFLHLSYDDQFELDIDQLKTQLTPAVKLVLLTHPNNPTGSIISDMQLNDVIEAVEASNAYLLMDETYWELSYSNPPPHAAELSKRAISVATMSKAFGVPGIRIGWLAGDPRIVDAVRAVREQTTICNSVIGEKIAFEILKKKDHILAAARIQILDNLSYLENWLADQPELEWVTPKGGIVGFPRLKQRVSSRELCKLLVNSYKTFTLPGDVFNMPEYFRLGFGIDKKELMDGLNCLGSAIQEWKGQKK